MKAFGKINYIFIVRHPDVDEGQVTIVNTKRSFMESCLIRLLKWLVMFGPFFQLYKLITRKTSITLAPKDTQISCQGIKDAQTIARLCLARIPNLDSISLRHIRLITTEATRARSGTNPWLMEISQLLDVIELPYGLTVKDKMAKVFAERILTVIGRRRVKLLVLVIHEPTVNTIATVMMPGSTVSGPEPLKPGEARFINNTRVKKVWERISLPKAT